MGWEIIFQTKNHRSGDECILWQGSLWVSNLSYLQILNLTNNNLSGRIPACLGDLKAMAKRQTIDHYLFYAKYRGACFVESLVININSLLQKYTKTLPLVTSIDLSGNSLAGEIPEELMKLSGLLVLNLSRNQISGQIPKSISALSDISSLDQSNNNLSGVIPTSISSLSFLSSLNLSDNILSGKIPFIGHMVTFGASSFAGNPGLCGDPLIFKCPDDYSWKAGPIKEEEAGMDDVHDRWFYLSIALGFAAGVLEFSITNTWKKQQDEPEISISLHSLDTDALKRRKF
ncbi:hypothetical protein Ancab_006565 [Ancistrocladus abbreviatus]